MNADWVEFNLGLAHRGGVPWYNAKVHPRWKHHTAQTRGRDPRGKVMYRCACGAFGPAPWTRLDPWPSWKQRRARSGAQYESWAAKWTTQLNRSPLEGPL